MFLLRKQGFTLVEVMISSAIMAALGVSLVKVVNIQISSTKHVERKF